MLKYLHSLENHAGNVTDMTVLERQRAKWLLLQQQQSNQQQRHQQQNSVIQSSSFEFYQMPRFHGLNNNDFDNLMTPRTEIVRDKMGFASNSLGIEHSISRTYSCPPVAATGTTTSVAVEEEKGADSALMEKMGSTTMKSNLKKRKAEFGEAEECKDKRIKCDAEEVQSKGREKSSRETSSTDTAKENSKACEVQKPDYIHVRARRGQATDSHSLAERARREKISKKMKSLQDLVPGCNKITGKAGMLDEIINYVQSLQGQVEFLSMKLAALNPRLEFNTDNFFAKEFPAHVASFPTAAASSPEMAPNLVCLQFSPLQQGATSCGLDMQINPPQATQTATSSSLSIPETYLQSSCFPQVQPFSTLDTDLQTLYNVEFH